MARSDMPAPSPRCRASSGARPCCAGERSTKDCSSRLSRPSGPPCRWRWRASSASARAASPRCSRWPERPVRWSPLDRPAGRPGTPQPATGAAIGVALLSFGVAALDFRFHSMAALVAAAVLLDGAVQLCNVLSLRSLYIMAPELRGRLNGLFLTFDLPLRRGGFGAGGGGLHLPRMGRAVRPGRRLRGARPVVLRRRSSGGKPFRRRPRQRSQIIRVNPRPPPDDSSFLAARVAAHARGPARPRRRRLRHRHQRVRGDGPAARHGPATSASRCRRPACW